METFGKVSPPDALIRYTAEKNAGVAVDMISWGTLV